MHGSAFAFILYAWICAPFMLSVVLFFISEQKQRLS